MLSTSRHLDALALANLDLFGFRNIDLALASKLSPLPIAPAPQVQISGNCKSESRPARNLLHRRNVGYFGRLRNVGAGRLCCIAAFDRETELIRIVTSEGIDIALKRRTIL